MAPYQPPDAHYNQIPIEEDWKASNLLKNGGRMLYNITKKYKLKYVWYNEEMNVLELWGPYYAFSQGAKEKISKIIANMKNDNKLVSV